MSELIGLNVLEVQQVKLQKSRSSVTGVQREIVVADLRCEGGLFRNVPIAEGVDVPEGWSGKAACEGQIITYTTVWNGQGNTRTAVVPVRIDQFTKIKQVVKGNIMDTFFSSAPASVSEGQQKGISAADGKGVQNPK